MAKVNGGTLKGSLSGTITSGISVIDLFNNGQAIMNSIRSIGNTTDGLPFLIDETGVGSQADNFGRVVSISLAARFRCRHPVADTNV